MRSNKRAIEDHFDLPSHDLINNLRSGGPSKKPLLKDIEAIAHLANFVFVRAKAPYGTAAPVLDVAHLIGNEPFIYTFADDFFTAEPRSRFQQMIDTYEVHGGSVLSCMQATSAEQYDRYGFIGGEQVRLGLYRMNKVIEKPGKAAAPSNLASVSSFLFEPAIISYIVASQEKLQTGKEFYIQPAMQAMMDDGFAYWGLEVAGGTYHDTGDKLEYLKTVIDFGLKHKELGVELRAYLKAKLK